MASPHPPYKKRAVEDPYQPSLPTALSVSYTQTNPGRPTPKALLFHQEQQIESLQAELEHERSMRQLDQKRATQTKNRLEKQVALAVEEAASSKSLLDQVQEEGERIAAQLRQARDRALREVQALRFQQSDEQDLDDSDSMVRMWQNKCEQLEEQIKEQDENEQALRDEIQQMRSGIDEKLSELRSSGNEDPEIPLMEDAPPAVLKELNRVRLRLADSERSCRQLTRALDASKQHAETLLQEREEARATSERFPAVKQELQTLRTEYESLRAEHMSWKAFGRTLADHLQSLGVKTGPDGPPEMASVQRFFDVAEKRVTDSESKKSKAEQDCDNLRKKVTELETSLKDANEKERKWKSECREIKMQLESAMRKIRTLESGNEIAQREADSLRALIKTFDDLPLAPSTPAGRIALASETSSKTLEVSLASARQEVEVLLTENARLLSELEAATKSGGEYETEIERIREKFGKLRDALQAEKAKVEKAEERANEAQALAGKGSFNPDHTRVLHFKETPLVEALREEVKVLKRQIEAVTGEKSSKLAPDPDKLNQRLKKNFKEQISLFREGVYLMTGFKIDMLPGTDRPTFRVRSVFAEREEDHLMLKWPKTEQVTSLDILTTDLAKLLATTSSYDYMTKFHSLPAFLASVQLSLFEKQTMQL